MKGYIPATAVSGSNNGQSRARDMVKKPKRRDQRAIDQFMNGRPVSPFVSPSHATEASLDAKAVVGRIDAVLGEAS